MKKLATLTMLLTVLILKSCSFDDSEMVYEEKLVIFASISANLPVIDTVLVSKTASINDESTLSSDLVVNDAQVRLIEDSTGKTLDFFNSVNVTGGLPILRVSPDHGPAFDIANKNSAKTSSLVACLKFIEKY